MPSKIYCQNLTVTNSSDGFLKQKEIDDIDVWNNAQCLTLFPPSMAELLGKPAEMLKRGWR